MTSALEELGRAPSAWDAALDALVAATEGVTEAENKLRTIHAPADVYWQIGRARETVMMVIGWRLRAFVGWHTPPMFREERLTPPLPAPR